MPISDGRSRIDKHTSPDVEVIQHRSCPCDNVLHVCIRALRTNVEDGHGPVDFPGLFRGRRSASDHYTFPSNVFRACFRSSAGDSPSSMIARSDDRIQASASSVKVPGCWRLKQITVMWCTAPKTAGLSNSRASISPNLSRQSVARIRGQRHTVKVHIMLWAFSVSSRFVTPSATPSTSMPPLPFAPSPTTYNPFTGVRLPRSKPDEIRFTGQSSLVRLHHEDGVLLAREHVLDVLQAEL